MNNLWSALVNGAILSAVLTAAIALLLWAAPRRICNASTRYLVWWITLALVLALPVLCAFSVSPRSAVPTRGALAATGRIADAIAPPLGPWISSSGALRVTPGPWQSWLLAAWAASAAVLLFRLGRGYIAVSRSVAGAEDAPPRVRQRGPAWFATFGLDAARIRIACSARIAIPLAAGPRYPAILIPSHLAESLEDADLDHLGLHEAAHLARRDHLTLLPQRAIEALFWLHPVVRWIARRIDLEREIACDDMVSAATQSPQTYAACLTRLAAMWNGAPEPAAAVKFAEHRPHLSQRVELLMKSSRNASPHLQAPRLAALAVFAATLAGILIHAPAPVAFAAPQRTGPAIPTGLQLVTIFFNTAAMNDDQVARSAGAALNFFDQQQATGTKLSFIAYDGTRLLVYTDFTSDRGQFEQALRQVKASETPARDMPDTLKLLKTVIDMLAPLQEKKLLVYYTAGSLPQDIADSPAAKAVVDAAVRANVAIFPIDARSLRAK